MIIDQICNHKLLGDNWCEELFKVLFRFYDRSLFEQGLAKSINRALKDGCTYGYSVNKDTAGLREFLGRYNLREYKKTILQDDFKTVCQNLARASPECSNDE